VWNSKKKETLGRKDESVNPRISQTIAEASSLSLPPQISLLLPLQFLIDICSPTWLIAMTIGDICQPDVFFCAGIASFSSFEAAASLFAIVFSSLESAVSANREVRLFLPRR
jgi:hypothetical protein